MIPPASPILSGSRTGGAHRFAAGPRGRLEIRIVLCRGVCYAVRHRSELPYPAFALTWKETESRRLAST